MGRKMNRSIEGCSKSLSLMTVTDEELIVIAGGATACDTLHDLAWSAQARGDYAGVAFFTGAMEGAGCFK